MHVRGRAHHLDAGAGQVDQEHRVLPVVLAADQLALEEREVGRVERRHVPLHAVEQVAVGVPPRGRLDGVHVRPGALLGDRVALLAVAADGRDHEPLHLVGRGHLGHPGRGRGARPGQPVGDPAHLLLNQDLLQRGAAAAA